MTCLRISLNQRLLVVAVSVPIPIIAIPVPIPIIAIPVPMPIVIFVFVLVLILVVPVSISRIPIPIVVMVGHHGAKAFLVQQCLTQLTPILGRSTILREIAERTIVILLFCVKQILKEL